MADDSVASFLNHLTPAVREIAGRLVTTVSSHADFDVAIKWRQLTFAVDGDFDHWICAVAATSRHARLSFHYGAWLTDSAGVFDVSDAAFVRRITYCSVVDVDDGVVRDLLTQALDALPRFREK